MRINQLNPTKIKAAKPKTMIADGGGLYLLTGPSGSKSWVFRYRFIGRSHEMGLGSLDTFTLNEARSKALECRKLLAEYKDPLELKQAQKRELVAAAMGRKTFQDVAGECINSKRSGWKSAASDWTPSLVTYVYPIIGALPVAAVDMEAVLKCVRPIWESKSETARRVLNRIEQILDFARVHGYREGDNPAKWEGNIEHLLKSRGTMQRAGKVAKVQHLAAVPYKEVPAFLAKLRGWKGRTAQSQITAAVLEWLVLTCVRYGDVERATHEQIDWDARTWTIPDPKNSEEFVVPITTAAERAWQDIVMRCGGVPGNGRMFPASEEAAVLRLAKKITPDITIHGFRSSFRDWCAENGVARELAEMCLAHKNGNKTEAAYNRTTLIEQRREVMERWATFALGPATHATQWKASLSGDGARWATFCFNHPG